MFRAGRLTMAKSVISSMEVFHMQCQRLPSKTHKKLDKLVTQCVWGTSPAKKKVHLISWENLCKPKAMGGAGLQRAENVNKCLLAKLGWCILSCEGEAWGQLLWEKYGLTENGAWMFKHKQRESQVWMGIVWGSELLSEGLRWRITNGKRVLFWIDKWVGEEKLLDHCLGDIEGKDLYRTVNSYWQERQGWRWDEIPNSLPSSILLKLAAIVVSKEELTEDRPGWLEPNKTNFSV